MSVPTSLYLVQLEELRAFKLGTTKVGDLNLEDGALPPAFIIEAAIADLESGREALWCSFFLFVQEDNGHAVGSGGFRGRPGNGRVEVGYGVAAQHRGRGVATAATLLLVQEAFAQPTVSEIFAETSVPNIASRRVVEKAGFLRIGERESKSDGLVDQWLLLK